MLSSGIFSLWMAAQPDNKNTQSMPNTMTLLLIWRREFPVV
jgi:hypothetical protein